MITSEQRQVISDETVCISFRHNALRKGMNPSLLSLAMDKQDYRPFLNLDMVTSLGEGKLCIKIIFIPLKRCAGGVMVIIIGNEHGETSSNPGRG